jgi:hypothetical protein
MGSGAEIYVNFVKIGSGIQKLIRRTHTRQCDLISLHNKEGRLRMLRKFGLRAEKL